MTEEPKIKLRQFHEILELKIIARTVDSRKEVQDFCLANHGLLSEMIRHMVDTNTNHDSVQCDKYNLEMQKWTCALTRHIGISIVILDKDKRCSQSKIL